jgi:hypothetical protein
MLTKEFLVTIVGITVAVLAVCNLDFTQPIIEGWWGNGYFTSQARTEFTDKSGKVTAGPNYFDPNAFAKGSFVSTPQFQAVLSPRFSNLNYGADIKYNMPDRENLATPCHPLSYGDMVQENYNTPRNKPVPPMPARQDVRENYGSCGNCSGSGCVSCGKGGYGLGHRVAGGYELPMDFHGDGAGLSSNWQEVRNSIPSASVQTNALPVGTMATSDGAGNMQQVVVSERLYSVTGKNRNQGLADLIRGDLPIVPCNSGWFQVSVNPATSLWGGAMMAMGGDSDNYKQTLSLITKATGGSRTTNGGVNLSSDMPMYKAMMAGTTVGNLSAGGSDINYSMMP